MAALGLCCCARALPTCGEWGPLLNEVHGPLLAVASRCRARAPGVWASVVVACGLSSCGSQSPECRLSSCGAWAQLLCGMWDPPGPGIEPVSPALAGRFPTTAPPVKSSILIFKKIFIYFWLHWVLVAAHGLSSCGVRAQ